MFSVFLPAHVLSCGVRLQTTTYLEGQGTNEAKVQMMPMAQACPGYYAMF